MNTETPFRILHVDGDSFFASCEIALNRKLQGRPVWVGGGRRGDGIVIAANGAKRSEPKPAWRASRPNGFARRAFCAVHADLLALKGEWEKRLARVSPQARFRH